MLGEDAHDERRQWHYAGRPARLGRQHDQAAFGAVKAALDPQQSLVKVDVFPSQTQHLTSHLVNASLVRVLAEQTGEWAEQRRYMGPELLAKARKETIDDNLASAAQPKPELTAA